MIKSIAGLISFLFIISAFYNLFFWDRFNIDIFQYIEIEDLVKGVLFSMRPSILSLLAVLSIVIPALAIETLKIKFNVPKKNNLKRESIVLYVFMIISLSCALIPGYLMYTAIYCENLDCKIKISTLNNYSYFITYASLAFSMTAYRLMDIYFKKRGDELYVLDKKNSHWILSKIENAKNNSTEKQSRETRLINPLINCIITGLFFYFLSNAITLGMINSQKILQKEEYDYVISNEKSMHKGHKFFYLGATSTKYILSDTLMRSCFIVNKDSLPFLNVHHVLPTSPAKPFRSKEHAVPSR